MTTPFVKLGHLNGAFGTQGYLRVFSYTEPRSHLINYATWWLEQNDIHVPKTVESAQTHKGGRSLIAKLEGIDTPEQALTYRNTAIWIPQNQLPTLPEDEYYWHELIGMSVINHHSEQLGIVKDLIETGANDVLVIHQVDQNSKYLIPFKRPEIVTLIQNQTITVRWEKDWIS